MPDKRKGDNLYFVLHEENNKLIDQMEWADEVVKKETQGKSFEPVSFSMHKGQIYTYIRKTSINGRPVYGQCVILADSTKFDTKVLICPIYPFTGLSDKLGINIGIIPQIDCSCEFIGCLYEINFINKTRFILKPNLKDEPKSLCCLNNEQYLNLLISYRDFVCAIVKSNSTIRISYRNTDNEMLYTC